MESRQQWSELQRAFVAPARLTESRPRDVELTAAGRLLVVLAVVLGVGALVALVGLTQASKRQAANRAAILERGVMTTGTVARLWKDGDNRRKVAYRFDAEGQSFDGDANVSTERRRSLTVGAPIDVRYLPGNPKVNDLDGTRRSGLPAAVGPVVALGLAAPSALCLLAIRLQRRLLEDGRAVPALVTAHKTSQSSHGKHHSMTYDFPLLSGAIVSGRANTSSKAPAVGTVITVVYDPERPKQSRVYPFSLVRPV